MNLPRYGTKEYFAARKLMYAEIRRRALDGEKLEKIGRDYCITRERVRQIRDALDP